MEEMSNLISNIARFLAFGIGGVSVIVFLYAGFLFMTAAGDPQNTAKARMAIFGAFIGLVVAGAAFVIPRIVSQAIIEPAGGVSIVTDGQISCDTVLEEQLVAQQGANNAGRMNEIIRLIQQRQECSREIWDPEVVNPSAYVSTNASTTDSVCFAPTNTVGTAANTAKVGSVNVPIGLSTTPAAVGGKPVPRSYRDPGNNILVIFQDGTATAPGSNRPGDSSVCWLYVSRIRSWTRNY